MIIFRELRLSLPYVRVIFTRHANPNLASHAPKDKIRRGTSGSVWELMDIVVVIRTRSPNVIASRFNRHRRKFL